MYMRADGSLMRGQSAETAIDLSIETIPRHAECRLHARLCIVAGLRGPRPLSVSGDILPPPGAADPADLLHTCRTADRYGWLGFEGRRHDIRAARRSVADPSVTLDAMLYELRGPRSSAAGGSVASPRHRRRSRDNGGPSNESIAAGRLAAAGAGSSAAISSASSVTKVSILRRNGVPCKVLDRLDESRCADLRSDATTRSCSAIPSTGAVRLVFDRYFAIMRPTGSAKFRKRPCRSAGRLQRTRRSSSARFRRIRTRLTLDPVAEAIEQAQFRSLRDHLSEPITGRVRDTLEDW